MNKIVTLTCLCLSFSFTSVSFAMDMDVSTDKQPANRKRKFVEIGTVSEKRQKRCSVICLHNRGIRESIQSFNTDAQITFLNMKDISDPTSQSETYSVSSIPIGQVGTIHLNTEGSILKENNSYKVILYMYSMTYGHINSTFAVQTSHSQITHIKLNYDQNALVPTDLLQVTVEYEPL